MDANLVKIQFTLEIKHCLTTKSQISQGPSEHQQKRTSGRRSVSSRIPWDTRNSAMKFIASGNNGALSVWSYAGCVRHATAVTFEGEPGSNLGNPRQARAELREFWPPRRPYESPELRSDIENAVCLVPPSKQTDRPFLGGVVSQRRKCSLDVLTMISLG